jgi:hypothetical protein
MEKNTVADRAGDLQPDTPVGSGCNLKSFIEYDVYNSEVKRGGVPADMSECTTTSSNFTGPCSFKIGLSMSTMLVTSLSSARGTTWQKIMFDEGSIVGGITFVTWFLSIFII